MLKNNMVADRGAILEGLSLKIQICVVRDDV